MCKNKTIKNEKKETNNSKIIQKQHPVKNRVLQQAAYYQNNFNNESLLQMQGIIGNQKVGQLLRSEQQGVIKKNILQLAPEPLNKKETYPGSKYIDKNLNITLTKLNDKDAYLYKETYILYWNKNYKFYLTQDNKIVNPKYLKDTGKRILDITQGELGWIQHNNNPEGYTHLRTSNAYTCIILIIHDTELGKSLMAHIHRGNTDNQIKQMMNSVKDEESISVKLITSIYKDSDEKEEKIQKKRMTYLHNHFKKMKKINYELIQDQENATLTIESGKVSHHKNTNYKEDLGLLSYARAMAKEKVYKQKGDNSMLFDVRTSNISELTDFEYEHINKNVKLIDIIKGINEDPLFEEEIKSYLKK